MNLLDRAVLLAHILRWRLTWDRRDTAYLPAEPLPARFKSARAAADMIPDHACVISCGISGNARCSILFWAIRERFEQSGRPQGLTWISVGGQGGRGRAPGTVEEVGLDGLVTTYIAGHTETAKSMLHLADAGRLELHTLPQSLSGTLVGARHRKPRPTWSHPPFVGRWSADREGAFEHTGFPGSSPRSQEPRMGFGTAGSSGTRRHWPWPCGWGSSRCSGSR